MTQDLDSLLSVLKKEEVVKKPEWYQQSNNIKLKHLFDVANEEFHRIREELTQVSEQLDARSIKYLQLSADKKSVTLNRSALVEKANEVGVPKSIKVSRNFLGNKYPLFEVFNSWDQHLQDVFDSKIGATGRVSNSALQRELRECQRQLKSEYQELAREVGKEIIDSQLLKTSHETTIQNQELRDELSRLQALELESKNFRKAQISEIAQLKERNDELSQELSRLKFDNKSKQTEITKLRSLLFDHGIEIM
ncbi:MAG: hypothetical protein AB7C96_05510 [Hydrogenovibrio sp.]